MKRPLAVIGFSYLISLAVAVRLGINTCIAVSTLLLIAGAVFICLKQLREYRAVICALVAACMAFGVFSAYSLLKLNPLSALYDSEAYITGTVSELPYENYGRYYYIVKTEKIDIEGVTQNTKVRVSSSVPLEAEMSDRVTLAVKLMSPDGKGYSSKSYNYSKGIGLYAYVLPEHPVTVTPADKKPIYYYVIKFRVYLNNLIKTAYQGQNGALLSGILLGNTSDISEKTVNDFRKAGVSHLLAVSGMHTAFIGKWLMAALERLKAGKKLSAVIASAGVIFFMAFTGFSSSVTRAGIMTVLYLLGNLFPRTADSINSLGASCLIMCIINPYSVCDTGLLLSVLATLGLIVITPKIRNRLNRGLVSIKNKRLKAVRRQFSALLSESLGATLFTLPVTVTFFESFSLVNPITNIFTVMPSTIFMAAGAVSLVFSKVSVLKPLFYSFYFVTNILGDCIRGVVGFLAELPFSSILMPYAFVSLCIAASLTLLGIAVILSKKKNLYRLWAFLSVLIFGGSCISYQLFNINVVKTCVIDVNGNCAVAVIKNKHGILLECGGDKLSYIDIENALNQNGIEKLDFILMSNLDRRRAYSCDEIIKEFSPNYVFAPEKGERLDNLISACNNSDIKMYNAENAKCGLWKNERAEVFSENEGNHWIYFKSGDYSVLVCPEKGDCGLLPEELRSPSVLVINGEIPDKITNINSGMAVVSDTAENSAEIKNKLISMGFLNIFTTGESGNIIIENRSDNYLTVRSER